MKKAKGLQAAFKEFFGITSEQELQTINTSLDEEKNKGKRVMKEFLGITSEQEFQAIDIDENNE